MIDPTQLSFFLLTLLLLSCICSHAQVQESSLGNKTIFEVGVILDMDSSIGKMSNVCISLALKDFYKHHHTTTKVSLQWKDSKQDVVKAASVAQALLQTAQVKAIIGPQTSAQAQFVAELGERAQIPILSFSATSPLLSMKANPYFIRTSLNESSQVRAVAALIQAFEWREVVCIYQDTIDYGTAFVLDFTNALQEASARVTYKSVISHLATDDRIVEELLRLKAKQTRVFVVHLSPSLSSRLFLKAHENEMMNKGYVWIVTDSVAYHLDYMNFSVIQSMQGVVGVKPYIPNSNKLKIFKERWKREFLKLHPKVERADLSIHGLWAYDTVCALALAAEMVGTGNVHFPKLQITGQIVLNALLKTNFKGLGGQFNLIDRQLVLSAFEIVNVNGQGGKNVGFWTPKHGLEKDLNTTERSTYSTSKDHLKTISWPGDSKIVPKGWEIPIQGKKLKIGVPKREAFLEFLNVTQGSQTNVTGYVIKIFEAALERLKYKVDHEYVPYINKSGYSNGTYDNLVDEVYNKNFDAVVGDVTIRHDRSLHVDFTGPFMDSGVSLIVLANGKSNKAWIFLKPLSWDLWLMTGAAFVFTGIVVWVLEHRVNDEFRGPLAQQIGLMLWFSFSTLVFAHRERLVSNLSRFVVIIWVFVVLILTSSYTASLTSRLTIEQLRPSVNDIYDLIRNNEIVGYQKESFVEGLLKTTFKVPESNIKALVKPEEYAEALNKGTKGGGVGGVMDEIPYLKSFLAKNQHCAKYKLVGPIYKTGGFGFVFPKGSPLVPDLSREILNITERKAMKDIVDNWDLSNNTCLEKSATAQSNSLTLESFWGLFLITGTASILAFVVSLSSFLHEQRRVLFTPESDSSTCFGQRLIYLLKLFIQRDLTRHTLGSDSLPPVRASLVDHDGNTMIQSLVLNDERQNLPFADEPPARRRWNLLFRAWLFRSKYVHLHEYN